MQVACVVTTTSCFAPRAADDVVAGGRLRGYPGKKLLVQAGRQCSSMEAAQSRLVLCCTLSTRSPACPPAHFAARLPPS